MSVGALNFGPTEVLLLNFGGPTLFPNNRLLDYFENLDFYANNDILDYK